MKWNAAYGVLTAVTLALATLLAVQAHALCGSGQKISYRNADCLDASWDNHVDALSNGQVTATNTCPEYGTVVAKIELTSSSCNEFYWQLITGAEFRQNTQSCDVEEVFCCKDTSDLCNISDIANEDSCLEQFSQSSASETCEQPSASVPPYFVGGNGVQCDISAHCKKFDGQVVYTGIKVDWLQVPDVHNCNGRLVHGAC